ncbi:hypothetical protein Pmani_006599 [Petrolisthes manimaculis]|uniref:C-type lectin domain-containing protein n=1 Tax=Petrolisthes manimaculis TaxID=1843537 RepID=A0AAE1UGA7_9EUCA|nr:hypothetical protein Pmani_006599 [Petrolisthes manimaculis]
MVWWDGNREEGAQAYYTCGHGNAFCSGGNVLTLTCSSLNITSTSSSSFSSSRPIWIPDTSHPANLTCVDVTLTCPANYTCYDGLCYRLMTPGTDWYANEALKECGSEGGMLAAPTTNIQITFLQHLLLQAGVEEAGLGLSDRNDFGYEWEGVYNQSGEVEVKKEHPWITAQFTVLYTNSSKILGFLSNERRSHYICQYPGVVDCQRPPPLPTTADDTTPELNHDGDLSFLATATYTCPQVKVFKAADTNPKSEEVMSRTNLCHYNEITVSALRGSGVNVWDSTLPLSLGYNHQCSLHPTRTSVNYWWKCHDKRHVGYVLVEQYVDMLLNHACNSYLLVQQHIHRGHCVS